MRGHRAAVCAVTAVTYSHFRAGYGAVFAYGILYYPSWQTSSENLISMLKINLYYLLIFFIGFFLVAVTLQEIIIVNARFYCIYLFRLYPYPFQLFHFHWY